MEWLNAERARVYAVAALLVAVGVVGAQLLRFHGYDEEGIRFGRDLGCFWSAGRLVREGLAAGVYDPHLLRSAELAVYPPGAFENFFYPPIFLMLCIPLAYLPFVGALAAFMGVSGAGYLAAVYQAGRSRWVVIAAAGYTAVVVNLMIGQNGMLTAALLGGGLTLMDRRPRWAGLLLGCMVIKPHLALAVPVYLLLSRRWNVLGFAAVSAVGLVGASTLLLGWSVWPAFIKMTEFSHQWMELSAGDPGNKFQSVFALTRGFGASVRAAYAGQAVVAGLGLAALGLAIRKRVSGAIERSLVVVVSLLCTPFLWPYDLVVLAFPLIWLLVEWRDKGFPRWGKLVLVVMYVLPITPSLRAGPGHLCLLGMVGLLGYLIWVVRRFGGCIVA